jgi:hypothetical protein
MGRSVVLLKFHLIFPPGWYLVSNSTVFVVHRFVEMEKTLEEIVADFSIHMRGSSYFNVLTNASGERV